MFSLAAYQPEVLQKEFPSDVILGEPEYIERYPGRWRIFTKLKKICLKKRALAYATKYGELFLQQFFYTKIVAFLHQNFFCYTPIFYS